MMLHVEIDDAALDRLADKLAQRLGRDTGSPWLDAQGAAEHIGCSVSRVRKLTMTGELPVHRDGRRTLYRREELDAYIANGGAVSP